MSTGLLEYERSFNDVMSRRPSPPRRHGV